jgi:DNA-binding GntR family transcriptional regulator
MEPFTEPFAPARMADRVARLLRDRIVAGELDAGARVDVTTIAADLGISRTPVREAILQLEASGLVIRQPYRGTVVAGVDAGRLEEVTALRIDLEGRAAVLGVPRLTDADIDRMGGILDELDRRRDDDGFSLGLFNELNRSFHGVVYEAADSPVLLGLIRSLEQEADRIRLHFDVRAPLAEEYHGRILEACRRRDGHAAALATRLHLVESYVAMRGGDTARGGLLADVVAELGLEVAR